MTPSAALAFTVGIMMGSAAVAAQVRPAPARPAPTQKPATAQKPTPAPVPATPPAPTQVCEYITPEEAKGLLGGEATPSSAPTKGLFTSCGYTSAGGDTLTVYVSDYGLPSVAKQFFEKTREVLKTATNEDALGVPAFMHVTAPEPAAAQPAPGAAPAPAAPAVVMLLALRDHRTVKLEASGPLVTQPHQLPKLRAIITRVVSTLPVPAPSASETPR